MRIILICARVPRVFAHRSLSGSSFIHKRAPWRRALVPLTATLAIVAGGCAGGGEGTGEGASPRGGNASSAQVVATTAVVADIARHVLPSNVAVRTIMGAGSDPHHFEPKPSDARALAGADLVVRSGGDIDQWVTRLPGYDAQRAVDLGAVAGLVGGDPHWWHDPRRAARAVRALALRAAELGIAQRETLEGRAAAFAAALGRLSAAVRGCIDRLPVARRQLVTTHRSLQYFARRFGLVEVGAVIPSLSTEAEPSPRDIQRLAAEMRRRSVPAVFPEHGSSDRLERALVRATGARLGDPLYTDSLAPSGRGASYLGMLASNADAVVRGLSGGRFGCRAALASAAGSLDRARAG